MKTLFLMATLLVVANAPPQPQSGFAPSLSSGQEPWVLDGQISVSGAPLSGDFTLRVGLFTSPTGGRPLVERQFDDVELQRGRFSVDLAQGRSLLRGQRVYVEVALRPAARRYADFETLSPRRLLTARSADQRLAARPIFQFHAPAHATASLQEGMTP